MKHILYIALLQMVGVMPGGAADEAKTPFRHAVAADFGACPDGHKALRDIPIVWGLVGPLYKKPADYDDKDRELMRKVEKEEVVFGGDILPSDPPKTQVICKQCGFSYEDMDVPEIPASWWKSAKTTEKFRIKFSKTLLGFPLLIPVHGSISYSQSLSADGKQLDNESVSYRTTLTFDEALKALRQWLIDNHKNPADLKPMELAPVIPADPFLSQNDVESKAKTPDAANAQGTERALVDASTGNEDGPSKEVNPAAPAPVSPNYEYFDYEDGVSIRVARNNTDLEAGMVSINLNLTHKDREKKAHSDGK
jgi:hypothetical protein